MVAGTLSDMPKEGHQTVVFPEVAEQKTSKKHVILTSWASVATALLLVVLVGGAFYAAELKSRQCKETVPGNGSAEHHTKNFHRTYDKDGEKTQEDFHVDEDAQTELIIKKSDDGNIELMTAIDYKKKISATYLPAADMCLLLAGVEVDAVDDMDVEDKTIVVNEEEFAEEDYKVSENKVTDLSILPQEMKTYCQGKPTYWLQPDDDDDLEDDDSEADGENGAARNRRALCFYVNGCYYRYGIRICARYRRCY